MLSVKKINISNIGPIENLNLSFDKHFNIICGQNGIGKTTILDCIAQSFLLNRTSLKRTASKEKGGWSLDLEIDGALHNKKFELDAFHPNETNPSTSGFYESSNDVIVFKTHRDIPYKLLETINTDPQKKISDFARETVSGSLPSDLKSWFVNRHMWSKHEDHLDEFQLKNIALAKECFSKLNKTISFKRVNPNSNDIMLNTPNGEIYFEYLSSGFKSCMAVLIGLIKEIEFRYKEPSKFIKDFNGIVFIDEIDLHLHPEWQAKIYSVLKSILPKAQIFTSTHSPHIIQVAEPSEIIPLTRDSNGQVRLNPLLNTEYGCKGWTVEEILKDVMGMEDTRSIIYYNSIIKFNEALEKENFNEAESYFHIIDQMLHPENSLRKILQIQLTGLPKDD